MPTTTALYAGILGLMAIALGAIAGRTRGQTGIFLGDGGNAEVVAAMRRHANFVENVPLLLVLMGLVMKNGILLVDYTNQLRDQGLARAEAILRAGPVRMRPVLMTSGALMAMAPTAKICTKTVRRWVKSSRVNRLAK